MALQIKELCIVNCTLCIDSAGEFGEAGEIFADNVEFDVYAGSNFEGVEVGVLEGVGDDGHAEGVALGVAHC